MIVNTHTYRNHTILVDFSYDRGTRKYRPMASISWKISEVEEGQYFLNSKERCDASLYALSVALNEAVAWIDRRMLESKVVNQ